MRKVYFNCATSFELFVQGERVKVPCHSKRETVYEYFLNGTIVAKSVEAKNGVFSAWIDKEAIEIPKSNLKPLNHFSFDFINTSAPNIDGVDMGKS